MNLYCIIVSIVSYLLLIHCQTFTVNENDDEFISKQQKYEENWNKFYQKAHDSKEDVNLLAAVGSPLPADVRPVTGPFGQDGRPAIEFTPQSYVGRWAKDLLPIPFYEDFGIKVTLFLQTIHGGVIFSLLKPDHSEILLGLNILRVGSLNQSIEFIYQNGDDIFGKRTLKATFVLPKFERKWTIFSLALKGQTLTLFFNGCEKIYRKRFEVTRTPIKVLGTSPLFLGMAGWYIQKPILFGALYDLSIFKDHKKAIPSCAKNRMLDLKKARDEKTLTTSSTKLVSPDTIKEETRKNPNDSVDEIETPDAENFFTKIESTNSLVSGPKVPETNGEDPTENDGEEPVQIDDDEEEEETTLEDLTTIIPTTDMDIPDSFATDDDIILTTTDPLRPVTTTPTHSSSSSTSTTTPSKSSTTSEESTTTKPTTSTTTTTTATTTKTTKRKVPSTTAPVRETTITTVPSTTSYPTTKTFRPFKTFVKTIYNHPLTLTPTPYSTDTTITKIIELYTTTSINNDKKEKDKIKDAKDIFDKELNKLSKVIDGLTKTTTPAKTKTTTITTEGTKSSTTEPYKEVVITTPHKIVPDSNEKEVDLKKVTSVGTQTETGCTCIGEKGERGQPGTNGGIGQQGYAGIPGVNGARGEKGERGLEGLKGNHGDTPSIDMITENVLKKLRSGDASNKMVDIEQIKKIVMKVLEEEKINVNNLREKRTETLQLMKGEKGDPAISYKGERGYIGLPGITGLTGPKGEAGERGPQGFRGNNGRGGPVGPIGVKGEKGAKGDKSFINKKTTEYFRGKNELKGVQVGTTKNTEIEKNHDVKVKGDTGFKANVIYTAHDLDVMFDLFSIGTFVFVSSTNRLYIRAINEWLPIQTSSTAVPGKQGTGNSIFYGPGTGSEDKKEKVVPTPDHVDRLLLQSSLLLPPHGIFAKRPYLMMVALNKPTNGRLGGIGGADYMCFDQANAAGLDGGTFRAFLSDSYQGIKYIMKDEYKKLPVANFQGEQLFASFASIYNTIKYSAFNPNIPIYSFDLKDVRHNKIWPIKKIWHGAHANGESNRYRHSCKNWKSDRANKKATAASITSFLPALNEETIRCNQKLIVLCVQTSLR